jgi:hypothetical protein
MSWMCRRWASTSRSGASRCASTWTAFDSSGGAVSFLSPARFYTADEFEGWLLNAFAFDPARDWRPRFVVLHNTSEPTIAQRPHGFTAQHMVNIRDGYESKTPPWHAGPHVFVDQNGVWLFSDMRAPGVHSPSWNGESWGMELLGEYEVEAAQTGPGAAIVANAVRALAAMHLKARLDSSTIHLHKWDPKTDHKSCPGRNIDLGDVQHRVHNRVIELMKLKGAHEQA